MKVRVLVRLKPGILDVQGAAVKRALAGLGFTALADVRVGKLIELTIDARTPADARASADEMCKKLLANPVLEDYTIEAIEAPNLAEHGAGR